MEDVPAPTGPDFCGGIPIQLDVAVRAYSHNEGAGRHTYLPDADSGTGERVVQ